MFSIQCANATESTAISPHADYVTPGKKNVKNDTRTTMPSLEIPGDAYTLSDGWTWVAALLVAALFIVAGYLDQESGVPGVAFAAWDTTMQAPVNSGPPTQVDDANWAHRQMDKGY